jgi:hypothetical protein
MRLLAAALIALIPASAGAVAAPGALRPVHGLAQSPPNCPRTTGYYAWQRGEPVRPHKLTELPPANAYAAVFRHIGRCEVPVVVKYGVGGR